MSKASLRAALNAGQFLAAPGIHDMIAASVANKVGFDFVYASGYWMTASAYGLPDAGIATLHADARPRFDAGPHRECERHRRCRYRLWRTSQRAPHRARL